MEKLKLFIVGIVFGIVYISLGSWNNLDDRWKVCQMKFKYLLKK